ncbi:hypothetical protein FSARC_12091 [Fusarium sarcochroum]|uniref:Amidohydrolase-related domain-containing protein n=1 Tax=Fusarium sarcochroum TaxID=1208366 RepID=A0A8H4TB04_9HYPO|nr:hypothetical protein FSARC_12091 [Fusarium sarcochroum]
MSAPDLPPSAWNSHMHCFDPERHPFKRTRAYTPQPAELEALVQNSQADNVMLVQATIEDGYSGLVEHLANCRSLYPSKVVCGTIFWDPEDQGLKNLTECDFANFNAVGVQSVRIHGSYGGSGDDPDWVFQQFIQVASCCPVRKYNWSISAQLPLSTWSSIADTILDHPELKGLSIIADHNGSATPSDMDTPDFVNFLHLLKSGRVYVKLGALHRRSQDISLMEPVIKVFADTAPNAILWGSDWPHCNVAIRGLTPTAPLKVDANKELRLLREWLTDQQWHQMLVSNPRRVFGIKEES